MRRCSPPSCSSSRSEPVDQLGLAAVGDLGEAGRPASTARRRRCWPRREPVAVERRRARHQPDLELAAAPALPDHEVAQETLAAAPVIRGQARRGTSDDLFARGVPGSEASRQSVTSTMSFQRPGAWKPQTSRPSSGSAPNEYSSLFR